MTQVQILDETACISRSAKSIGKGMNPTILPPAKGQIRLTVFFKLGVANGLEKAKKLYSFAKELILCFILLMVKRFVEYKHQ